MFCRYCGKQLKENEICSCQSGAGGMAQPQQPYQQPVQPQQLYQQQPVQPQQSFQSEQFRQAAAQAQQKMSQNFQSAAAAVQNSGALNKIKELVLELFKNPVDGLRNTYGAADKLAQYCIGGVYLVFTLLFTLTAIMKMGASFGEAFGIAFMWTLAVAVVKVAHAAWFYFFSDKRFGFSGAAALYCAASLQEAACLLILFVLMLFGWSNYALITIMLTLLFIIASVANFTAACIIAGGKKGYTMFLLLSLILIAVGFLVGRSIVVSTIQRSMGGMFGGMF